MDCVIKIIAGPENGQEFRCTTGEAIIGRSPRSTIRLTSPSVSYEHAVISRTGDDFFIENLSAAGTYLNNDRVTVKSRLRARDQIRFGEEAMARVEAVPSTGSASSSRPLLIALVAIMILGMLLVVAFDPFSQKASSVDAKHAYSVLQAFVDKQADEGKLPRTLPPTLREAWRLTQAGDATMAAGKYEQIFITLQATDDEHGYFTGAAGDGNPTALDRLLAPAPNSAPLTDHETGVALIEFARWMKRTQLDKK